METAHAVHADWLDRAVAAVTRRFPRLRGRGRLIALGKRVSRGGAVVGPVAMGDCRFRMSLRPRDWIDENLHYAGRYEPDEGALFVSLLRPGAVVLDVGANIGYYAVAAGLVGGPRGRVVALEPVGSTFARLEENLRLNGLARVEAVRAAASDAPGTLDLHVVDGDPGCSSVGARAGGRVETVPAVRLDDLLAARGIDRVDVVKMDVEGAELRALRGMAGTLARCRPAVLLEINPPQLRAAGGTVEEVVGLLRGLGYRLQALDGTEPGTEDLAAFARGTRERNFLARPGEGRP